MSNYVIVGHSSILFNKPRDIDKYDVVVRLNTGYPRPELKQYMGTRTDLWFNWDGFDELYRSLESKFNANRHITWREYPQEFFRNLRSEQRQDKAPSMGMLAYYYILQRENPTSISLYGFDFFKTVDFQSPEILTYNQENAWHNFKKEEEWFWRTKPDFVKFYDENNKEVKMNSKSAKRISNKAIQEPNEYKGVKTIECKSCKTVMEYRGYKRGCPVCNTING